MAHGALDTVAFVDKVGLADGTNGVLYYLEGDSDAAAAAFASIAFGLFGGKAKPTAATSFADDVGEQVAKQADTIGTAAKKVDMPGTVVTKVDDAAGAVKPLTQAQEAAIRKINNIEKGHLKPHDYTGTIRDMTGNPVPKPSGGYWDHAQEMANSLRGLRKHAKTLEGATDPSGIAARERALEIIKGIEELTQGAGL